jgi:alkylation response protein AidB-like acyl-CoA dehydrogenase
VLSRFLPDDWAGLGAVPRPQRAALLSAWRDTLLADGLLAVGWPTEYGGRGRSVVEESILAEECTRAGIPAHPHPNDAFGFGLLGPTLLQWGTDAQKAYFLPRTLSGEISWAQGYSEPDAGSDLFSLRTRAQQCDGRWVINGQKIWQTAGLTANWIFALVRTDPDMPRSQGISFLLVPLQQQGVEVRGIKNIAGEMEFAEVFFHDAHTDLTNVIGGVNNGAKVALTLLGYERGVGGVSAALGMQLELDRLVELAKAHGLAGDSHARQRIARCHEIVYALRCIGARTLDELARTGTLGPESSITKLMTAEYRQTVTELALDILGADLLAPAGAEAISSLGAQPLGLDPLSGAAWLADFLHARPGTVYGGSSEIQRNTIAEQILGLPREPRGAR